MSCENRRPAFAAGYCQRKQRRAAALPTVSTRAGKRAAIVAFPDTRRSVFLPADPLKTPSHIAPTWYFTPFYSVLRATTADFMYVLMGAVALYVMLIWFKSRLSFLAKTIIAVVALLAIIGMLPQILDAKFWGVVLFGSSVIIIGGLPWLDHSPVKSIRYRPHWHKYVYSVFGVSFLTLGYLGTQLPTTVSTIVTQVCTLLYFSFFLLMPWWSTMGSFKPVPKRVRFTPH